MTESVGVPGATDPSLGATSGRAHLPGEDPDVSERPIDVAKVGVLVSIQVVVMAVRSGKLELAFVDGERFDCSEDIDRAAWRLVAQAFETPEIDWHLEQLRSYSRSELGLEGNGIVVAYLAMASKLPVEAGGVAIADPEALSQVIMVNAIERARSKLEYTSLATSLLEEPFTLGDLRAVYEAVWGEKLHPANFRRKVLATPGFVIPTGKRRSIGRGAGAELFRRGGSALLHPPLLRSLTKARSSAIHGGS